MENAKIEKLKWDIAGEFQKLWSLIFRAKNPDLKKY